MRPEDLELFKKHMPLYECYKKHAFIRNYEKDVYTDLIHLYTTYVNPIHTFSHWCSSCRVELVNYLYGWFTNEENTTWYREQEEVELEVESEVEPATESAPAKRGRKPKTT